MSNDAVVAIDVGGTDIKAALIRGREILSQAKVPTRAQEGAPAIVEAIVSAIDQVRSGGGAEEVRAIGLVVPGIVDVEAGVVVSSSNIAWEGFPLAQVIADRTGLPVGFGHDVRSAGLAERKWGGAQGADDFIFLPIGTGIAAAVILNGELYSGQGLAGEVGHGGKDEGLDCVCGAKGCLETLASAAALARRYRFLTGASAQAVPGALEVEDLVRQGDPVAQKVWDEGIDRLAETIAVMVTILDIPLVVIGGGLSKAGDLLFEPLREAVSKRLSYHHRPRIIPARLGHGAGMWGAALLGQEAAHFLPNSHKDNGDCSD